MKRCEAPKRASSIGQILNQYSTPVLTQNLYSRLYSEKAYVLSRGFVRRALEIPLGGLEDEITWFYYTKGGLARVLTHAEVLVQRSADSSTELSKADNELAIPRLSAGGALTLKRTLVKLRSLLEAKEATR
jgi:ubiquitin-conjugating enzyme E2 O